MNELFAQARRPARAGRRQPSPSNSASERNCRCLLLTFFPPAPSVSQDQLDESEAVVAELQAAKAEAVALLQARDAELRALRAEAAQAAQRAEEERARLRSAEQAEAQAAQASIQALRARAAKARLQGLQGPQTAHGSAEPQAAGGVLLAAAAAVEAAPVQQGGALDLAPTAGAQLGKRTSRGGGGDSDSVGDGDRGRTRMRTRSSSSSIGGGEGPRSPLHPPTAEIEGGTPRCCRVDGAVARGRAGAPLRRERGPPPQPGAGRPRRLRGAVPRPRRAHAGEAGGAAAAGGCQPASRGHEAAPGGTARAGRGLPRAVAARGAGGQGVRPRVC